MLFVVLCLAVVARGKPARSGAERAGRSAPDYPDCACAGRVVCCSWTCASLLLRARRRREVEPSAQGIRLQGHFFTSRAWRVVINAQGPCDKGAWQYQWLQLFAAELALWGDPTSKAVCEEKALGVGFIKNEGVLTLGDVAFLVSLEASDANEK
eukprot:1124900-Amphidinium_carterae.1